ncbi:hypothetical protein FHS68_004433 [Dyadobacter arcticus]|uniref:Reverse transcriptase domain-containing protein n=1 Tax=Dyadobacter arcticus TaxID=1078754 RepID=A0ABX0USQ1_9BACT|nr:hypothetical protein [Dyadobacter arcticus]
MKMGGSADKWPVSHDQIGLRPRKCLSLMHLQIPCPVEFPNILFVQLLDFALIDCLAQSVGISAILIDCSRCFDNLPVRL